jgi:hypothetical protein
MYSFYKMMINNIEAALRSSPATHIQFSANVSEGKGRGTQADAAAGFDTLDTFYRLYSLYAQQE